MVVLIDSRIILVSPLSVLARLATLLPTLEFWTSIFYSLLRIGGGFIMGTAAGIALAALSYRFKLLDELLQPLISTIKAVPVASFIILALFWISSRNLAVLITFMIVLPIIYSNVHGGIKATDKGLLEMAQVFKLSRMRTLRYIYFPQILPYFKAAAAVACGLSWKSGIAAEVIAMPEGSMGEMLQQAKIFLNTPDLFAWTLVIVIVSRAFEFLFLKAVDLIAVRLEVL